MKALFPRRLGAALQTVLVNTAGGITGGDRFAFGGHAAPDTQLTLTTQAAERAYRVTGDEIGQVRNRLFVGQRARINWLPQETILFEGCALDRDLSIELAEDAKLLLVEPLVFGRAAMGETLTQARLRDRIEVRRQGELLFLDRMDLSGDLARHLGRATIGGGAGALASLLYVAPDAEAHLETIRAVLPDTGGVSLIRDGVLFMRLVAVDGHALRQTLMPILDHLTENALPRPWIL